MNSYKWFDQVIKADTLKQVDWEMAAIEI